MEWVVLIAIGAVGAVIWSAIRGAGWRTSSSGNQTRLYKGSRVTVFESDGGWKYCIADPDDRTPPYFSDPYPSQEAATHEAMVFMDGGESRYQTKREIREAELEARSIEAAASAPAFCAEVYREVEEFHQSGKFTLTKLRPLKKKVSREIEALKNSYQHLYSEGNQLQADDIWAIRKKLQLLDQHLEELITWHQSGAKSERGSPPAIPIERT